MKARILVVDDEQTIREELCEALADGGFQPKGMGDARQALDAIRCESYDVCISDIRMPGMDGISLLKKIGEVSPETAVIMITAYGDMQTAIEALRSGATDYVLKPVIFEDILGKVRRLVESRELALEVRNFRRIVEQITDKSDMIGESSSMKKIGELIAKVAITGSNVLITGESGTGKELVARAIHASSDRVKFPFVPINCAAIPETLLESELFGHTKGAFTGAVAAKEGLLQAAGEGTIFLDEVGDMPMSIQAKLLRAVESREIQPVGSTRRIPIHARLITATNKDLKVEMDEGRFREDLYYRLAVLEIQVPPLRERKEDISLLVNHFVAKYNKVLRRRFAGVESAAIRQLVGYTWKGNIRELENTIERAMILAEGDLISVEDLPHDIRQAAPLDPSEMLDLRKAMKRFELSHIHQVIEGCHGDKREASKHLGLSLSSLYRKLEPENENTN